MQIELIIVADADRARRRSGDAAARQRVLLLRGDIRLLPCVALVVKDEAAVRVDIIVAGAFRAVAVRDGQCGGLRVLVADGDVDDAALYALGQRERIAVQAERHVFAVFADAQRLIQLRVLRQVIAAACQRTAGHIQRRKIRDLTGVLAVDRVGMPAVRFRFVFRFLRTIRFGRFFRVGFRFCVLRIGGRSLFRVCGIYSIRIFRGLRRVVRDVLRRIGVRRDGAHTERRQNERQHQQQTQPSSFHRSFLPVGA